MIGLIKAFEYQKKEYQVKLAAHEKIVSIQVDTYLHVPASIQFLTYDFDADNNQH